MQGPLIAIVGSIDPKRTDYDPPLRNVEDARQAAEALGGELARAGYRIIVYSSDPAFIEADIVRGYVAGNQARPASIQIRYPQAVGSATLSAFPEQASHPDLFDVRADTHRNWQVSFYMSLKDADGILLIGGAKSALITGLVAYMNRIPLVCIATFGGSAQSVWALSVATLATAAERRLMGLPTWHPDSAARLVQVLGAQRSRQLAEELERQRAGQMKQKSLRNRSVVAAAFMLLSVVSMLFGVFWKPPSLLFFGLFFAGTPLLAGIAGSIARHLFEYYRGGSPAHDRSFAAAIVLGMMAGFIAALLFVVAQWASNPAIKELETAIPPGLNLLIPFELIIGFIGGLTLEAVFTKLKGTDVVNVEPVAAKSP